MLFRHTNIIILQPNNVSTKVVLLTDLRKLVVSHSEVELAPIELIPNSPYASTSIQENLDIVRSARSMI